MPGYSEARRMGVWLGRRRRATSTQDATQALLTKSGAFYFPLSGIVCLTETVETLYLLGERDGIVGISGYVVRPPQARREKPRVSVFTSANIDKIL